MPDHVHIMISIPPKHAVAQVVGYIKGKSAIHMRARTPGGDGTSSASISGHAGISFRPWGETKGRCVSTSVTKKERISEKSSCACDDPSPL